MKTKRKSTRRTRKQRGGNDEIVDRLHEIMRSETITKFRTLAQTFYTRYPPEKKLNREKWISILKKLFQKNGIKLTFPDPRDDEVSRAVLSYYEIQSRCPGPRCEPSGYAEAVPKADERSPVQRLEGYLDFAYENLKGIVQHKIDHSERLLFSVICAEVLEITKRIRPGNADFVVLPHQWVYLLIRLYNHAHSSVILDSGLPQEIKGIIAEYYETMDHRPNRQKMAEEESNSREVALRMAPARQELRVPVARSDMGAEDDFRIMVTAERREAEPSTWDERTRNAGAEYNNEDAMRALAELAMVRERSQRNERVNGR